ncbi:hypothetical protein MASR1M12_09860 [Erysipelotrichia bacterium]
MNFKFKNKFNHLFIIENLGTSEIKTGKKLYESIKITSEKEKFGLFFRQIKSKAGLIKVLDEILSYSFRYPGNFFPMIHMDIHGTESGLLVKTNSGLEDLFLYEDINSIFRVINIECQNNLGIFLSSCYGFHSIMEAPVTKGTPFYFLIGPQGSCKAGFIDEKVPLFYRDFFKTLNLKFAMEQIEEHFQIFNCEWIFLRSMRNYFRNLCKGPSKKERIEKIMEKVAMKRKLSDLEEEEILHTLDNLIDPNEFTFEEFKRTFLMSDLNPNRNELKFSELRSLF